MYIKPFRTDKHAVRLSDEESIHFDPTRNEWTLTDYDPSVVASDIRNYLTGKTGVIFIGPDQLMWYVNPKFAVTCLGHWVYLSDRLTLQSQVTRQRAENEVP